MLFLNRNAHILFVIILLGGALMTSCRNETGKTKTKDDQPVVAIQNEKLYRSDIEAAIPKGTNPKDSLRIAKTFIQKWVNEQLFYRKAQENITDKDKDNIEQLVENYRKTLILYTYQEHIIREKMSKSISEDEMKKYYDNNKEKLTLGTNLVKGLYLKIPLNAPQKNELQQWYKSSTDEAVEKIEKYSLRNAVVYEYFYNKWRELGEVAAVIPGAISDSKQFLLTHRNFESRDSSYIYLLNIKEYCLAGSVPPYEYVKPQIRDLLINEKKNQFIQQLEEGIYKQALKEKTITFYNNEE